MRYLFKILKLAKTNYNKLAVAFNLSIKGKITKLQINIMSSFLSMIEKSQ